MFLLLFIIINLYLRIETVNGEWVPVKVPGQSKTYFVGGAWSSSTNGVAVGNKGSSSTLSGVIVRTTDKGLTWSFSNLSSGSFYYLTDVATMPKSYSQKVYFLAVDYSTTLKRGQVYVSSNNGSSWTTAATKFGGKTLFPRLNTVTIGMNGIAYAAGYFSGNGFKIFSASHSTAFTVWNNVSYLSKSMIVYGISTYDGVTVIAVGTNTTNVQQTGIIYSTQNGGASWTVAATNSPTVQVIYSASSASSTVAMIAGDSGYVAKTINGGLYWTILNVFNSTNYICQFHSISMISTSVVFISGYEASTGVTSSVYKTINGGTTWTLEQSSLNTAYCLAMYNTLVGFAGSYQGIYALTASKLITLLLTF